MLRTKGHTWPLNQIQFLAKKLAKKSSSFKVVSESTFTPSDAKQIIMACSAGEKGLKSTADFILSQNLGLVKPVLVFGHNLSSHKELQAIKVNQRIFYFNMETNQVSEAYSVNNHFVYRIVAVVKEEKNQSYLVPTTEGQRPFEKRRNNLHGYHIIAMTDKDRRGIYLPSDFDKTATFHEINQTFDVTDITYGPYKEHLDYLSQELNFTYTLYKRKDGVWSHLNSNNQVEGMLGDVANGNAEMVATSLTFVLWRMDFVTYLPALSFDNYAIFIRDQVQDDTNWMTYLKPFSTDLWLTLLLVALVMALWLHFLNLEQPVFKIKVSHRLLYMVSHLEQNHFLLFLQQLAQHMLDFSQWLWVSATANIGRKPSQPLVRTAWSNRIILFTCLLVGNVTWIGYRASITSELSIQERTYPFDSPEGLLKTDYKYRYKYIF